MNITYPHMIENCIGEKIIFKGTQIDESGEKLLLENYVAPGSGPVMHVHWLQDECLTVISGTIGYEVKGQPERYASEGETVFFKRGVPHRFWNAGSDILHCKGWINPPNSVVFYLTSIYDAQNKAGSAKPELFDGAYLITRYASEYALVDLPWLVKKIMIPMVYVTGQLLGKYKHFKDAPMAISTRQKKRAVLSGLG